MIWTRQTDAGQILAARRRFVGAVMPSDGALLGALQEVLGT
jgi:hypothetical protein